MTEREAVRMAQRAPEGATNFDDPCWDGVNPAVLNTCFDKGFLRWFNDKLIITPLGRRSCGGTNHERHH